MKRSDANDGALRTIAPDATVVEAVCAMEKYHVGALVVVEDGRATGIVTDRDLALAALARTEPAKHVRDCASSPLVSLPESSDDGDILRKLAEAGVRRVVLVDPEGRPVRVSATDDLIRTVAARIASVGQTISREFDLERIDVGSSSQIFGRE